MPNQTLCAFSYWCVGARSCCKQKRVHNSWAFVSVSIHSQSLYWFPAPLVRLVFFGFELICSPAPPSENNHIIIIACICDVILFHFTCHVFCVLVKSVQVDQVSSTRNYCTRMNEIYRAIFKSYCLFHT